MKILIVAPDLVPSRGGIQGYLAQFIRTLGDHTDNQLEVVVRLASTEELVEILPPSVFLKGCKGSFELLRFFLQVLLSVFCTRPDLIIVGHKHYGPIVNFLTRFFRCRYWSIVFGNEAWNIDSVWEKKAFLDAEKIISISSYTKKRLIEQLHIPEERFVIIPCTADSSRFQITSKGKEIRSKLGISEDSPVVLSVCRLEAQETFKSYDTLLSSLPDIRRQFPELHYIIVGTGSDRERLEKMIVDNKMQNFVHLIGFVSDEELPHYYSACDIHALPSLLEGFGIVHLEAMLSGKPVLASSEDGSQEVVFDEALGALVNPQDNRQISMTLIDMLQKSEQGQFEPNRIRQLAEQRFGLKAFEENIKDLFADN